MSEEKKLDEKELEKVTGGELLDTAQKTGPQRASGGCADCALSGKPECPYTDPTVKIKKLTGAEGCYSFIPQTY